MDEQKLIHDPPQKVLALYQAVIEFINEGCDINTLKVADITGRAGIGKGTAYEYFSSKEEIISSAILYYVKVCFEKLQVISTDNRTFQQKINEVMDFIDGEMIEITKEVAYAMNNFYRSSKAKKVEIKNELGEVVDKMLREVPYSGQSIDGEGFMIEDFPDLNCDVEHCVLTKMEQQDIHTVINQLNSEERMIIYGIFFENKTQTQMAEIMGISRQMLSYKLKSTLNKMREMYMNKFF